MSDLTSFIYHERGISSFGPDPSFQLTQPSFALRLTSTAGSMMCLQHSINNLLQSELFSPASLADIARELDLLERAHLDPGTRLRGEEAFASQNVDESGFFSVQVAEKALEVVGLRLVRWGSEELAHVHDQPEQIEAFLLNHELHWFSLRRFGPNRFYNLDSCIPEPTWISETYLGLQLREFELRGYSIFAIVPSPQSHLGGLPPCDASAIAPSLPSPSGGGAGGGMSSSGSHIRFDGGAIPPPIASSSSSLSNGAASFSASTSGFGPSSSRQHDPLPAFQRTLSKGKRPASDDDDDDDIIFEGGTGGARGDFKSASSSTTTGTGSSSVEEESEQRSRRRRRKDDDRNGNGPGKMNEMSEDDMMARAIEESLRVVAAGTGSGNDHKTAADHDLLDNNRARLEEEEEFQRALRASLEEGGAQSGEATMDDEEEEDAPTMEQLRAKRLARFG
ncbi:hypothetical protein JCM3766R1_000336 [Sporobolomyces carnicolor]